MITWCSNYFRFFIISRKNLKLTFNNFTWRCKFPEEFFLIFNRVYLEPSVLIIKIFRFVQISSTGQQFISKKNLNRKIVTNNEHFSLPYNHFYLKIFCEKSPWPLVLDYTYHGLEASAWSVCNFSPPSTSIVQYTILLLANDFRPLTSTTWTCKETNTFESVQNFDFSTLYTTLPHILIKKKFTSLINWAFKKSECEYICSNSFRSFFSSNKQKNYVNWTCFDTIIYALEFLLDNIFVRFGDNVYRQVIGIPLGTYCAPLIADLFFVLLWVTIYVKTSKDPLKQHLIQKFNNTFRYLDDILAPNNDDCSMCNKEIYPVELILNKANTNNDHCPLLDLDIYIINGKLNTKMYDKRMIFHFLSFVFHF